MKRCGVTSLISKHILPIRVNEAVPDYYSVIPLVVCGRLCGEAIEGAVINSNVVSDAINDVIKEDGRLGLVCGILELAILDSQIVDVNGYFKSDSGYKALYPGDFGVPSEDCNCRCALLQRAKWALNDEEFTKMNGKTNELQHFESVDDYNKFKSIFWEVTK